jgi:hypothetical protein
VRVCGLNSGGSGNGPVADCCENGNKPSDSTKDEELLDWGVTERLLPFQDQIYIFIPLRYSTISFMFQNLRPNICFHFFNIGLLVQACLSNCLGNTKTKCLLLS